MAYKSKPRTMKLLFASVLFCVAIGNAAPANTEPTSDKKGEKKETKKETNNKAYQNKNLHSIKKWKINIEYIDGSSISKTIMVSENSRLSALETAFEEAEKHLKKAKNIKNYSVSPIPSNYILLAGD